MGLALLCPGQASQSAAMFDLALGAGAGGAVVEAAARALGEDPVALARAGSPRLFENRVAQPLVCAATLAAFDALASRLGPPRVVAGYSVGELAAYGCAGALPPPAAVALAATRAALMDGASPGPAGLLAVRGLPVERVEAMAVACGAEVAIVNGPEHAVLGGREAALDAAATALAAAGAAVQRLPVAVPAHTRLLAGAVGPFAEALERSALGAPLVPVLSGTTGAPVRRRADAVAALSTQLARRLEWSRCVQAAAELGATVFLELGPGSALARMAAELLPGVPARSVADFRSADGVMAWVERQLG